ncbi:MAG: hypothetical protein LBD03_07965 [Methanobrevibacter sp.]|jgi:hypothetical protein|nr:hypothetical protein [Candidatus Methanovirga procula]
MNKRIISLLIVFLMICSISSSFAADNCLAGANGTVFLESGFDKNIVCTYNPYKNNIRNQEWSLYE